jgi:outer membrane protein assembly factor BamB
MVVVIAVDEGRVVALDRATGAQRWQHDASNVHASAFGDDVIAIVTASGTLEVLDAADGTNRWTASVSLVGRLVSARVWVAAGRVVAAWTDHSGSHLRAFDRAAGSPIWADDAPDFASMPAVHDGYVVFAANVRRDGRRHVVAEVRSLAVGDGGTRWSRELRRTRGYWAAVSAASGGSAVAVVDLDGRVTALDARTGTVRWRRATGRRQYQADPLIVGGVFAMTTYGSGLTALGITDGAVVENDEPGVVQTLVTIEASAAAGDRLYLLVRSGNGDGGVWMLRPAAA